MLILVLLSISSAEGQRGGAGGVIDVVARFGAKADEKTDLSKPLLDAWKEACASTSPEKIAPADPSAFKEPKWITFNRIENLKLSGGGVFDGQGTIAYKREGCKGHDFCGSLPINITFKHFTVSAPNESPNTDGIHIGRSDGVNVLNSEIKTGDDCVSIGDEPVDGVTVKNYTMTNTSNGVRIKSWPGAEPGTCSNIHFEDITVTNEESKVKLSNISFKNIHGTSALPEAVKIICSATLPCENVEFADIEITHSGPTGPAVSQCLNVKPKVSGKQNPAACSAPIPAKPTPAA
ncbi:hypothetical protein CXB51_008351 [Gossypium anomalum]|uniref:Polygalacturonase n=1 Tax=Gossypium anomalum TaxID=47600 RepID=A0A8J6D7Z0_9ROSI|nr:hypothetical protein CXB51_008351 [Gossypium anomalum]